MGPCLVATSSLELGPSTWARWTRGPGGVGPSRSRRGLFTGGIGTCRATAWATCPKWAAYSTPSSGFPRRPASSVPGVARRMREGEDCSRRNRGAAHPLDVLAQPADSCGLDDVQTGRGSGKVPELDEAGAAGRKPKASCRASCLKADRTKRARTCWTGAIQVRRSSASCGPGFVGKEWRTQ